MDFPLANAPTATLPAKPAQHVTPLVEAASFDGVRTVITHRGVQVMDAVPLSWWTAAKELVAPAQVQPAVGVREARAGFRRLTDSVRRGMHIPISRHGDPEMVLVPHSWCLAVLEAEAAARQGLAQEDRQASTSGA